MRSKALSSFLRMMILFLLPLSVYAQQVKISGQVTDAADGTPLPGVNIVIKGTTQGTATNGNGHYSITVPKGSILEYSFVGYDVKEVRVTGDQQIINVALTMKTEQINEVVLVGYGTMKKSDLTGSISSVDSKDLTERPVSGIDKALQSLVSGLQVSTTSGMPGAGARIRIRGQGSLSTSSDPLWVIDGYIGADINTVAPEDIESIEVLKDASSTAIYGARGGNGVILVTTKKGKGGENHFSFSYYSEFRNVVKKMDVLDAPQYMRLRNEALTNDGFPAQFSQEEIALEAPVASTGYIANTHWQDVVFRSAMAHYFNFMFSGGNEKTTYSLGANFKTEEGIIHYSDYRKGSFLLNLNHEINKKMNLGVSIKAYSNRQRGFSVPTTSTWAYGAAGGAVISLPIYPVYDSLGDYYTTNIWDNPLLSAEGDKDVRTNADAQGTLFFSYEPLKGLTFKANMAGEYRTSMRTRFVTSRLTEATLTQNLAKGLIAQGNYAKWIGSVTGTYDKTFGENHHLTVLMGFEQEVITSNSHQINGTDINKESLLWYDFSAFDPDLYKPYSDWWKSVYISQFARVNYVFHDKYIFQGTVRRDGSSKFGPKKKYGIFPSFSAAWKMHREGFIRDLGVFSALKLRFSWGQSGNDRIALYQWLPEISYNVAHSLAVFGDNVVHGAAISKIPNENIGWEVSTITDAGLDMGFFENRLYVNLDYYDRLTSDLLWNQLLPLYTGYGDGWDTYGVKITSNLAKMDNKGFELTVGGTPVNKGDWKWTVDVNFSTNRNKVLNLGDQDAFYVGYTKIEVGQPIGNLWGYKTDGLYSLQDSINGEIPTGLRPGDQKYVDVNRDSVVNDLDRTYIGNALPDFIMGMNTRLAWKGVELSMIFNWVAGVDMYNGTYESLAKGDLGRQNGGSFLLDAWSHNNQESQIPRLSTNYQTKTSDRFVEDASYFKISNIMLSYNLPKNLLSKIKMSTLRVYVSGQNLITFTKYTGFDPEQQSGGNSNLNIGFDNKNYPSYRSITLGLNIGF